MGEILQRHWLGTLVCIFAVWGMYATSMHPKTPALLPLVLAGVFFWAWVFRGVYRFVGRTFRHNAVQGPK
jgi:4-hydroxybenzoate polyprenyltransferase